jgi:uncharacterized membrane protein (UPF0127 family)
LYGRRVDEPLKVTVARTRRERMRGLRARDSIAPDEALLIPRCRSVHTIGMRFPIKVAWLDGDSRVLAIRVVPPGRITLPKARARHVLEMHPDVPLERGERLAMGDRVPG